MPWNLWRGYYWFCLGRSVRKTSKLDRKIQPGEKKSPGKLDVSAQPVQEADEISTVSRGSQLCTGTKGGALRARPLPH